MDSLKADVMMLEQCLPDLQQHRFESPFANDIFEAVADWRQLGNSLIEGNPRANFPKRAREEYELLHRLQAIVSRRPWADQRRCAPLFEAAERIIRVAEARLPSKDGYLGFLRVTRQQFGFLQSQHGFDVVDEEPTSIRFASGQVYVELDCTNDPRFSCVFGLEPKPERDLLLCDLLFLNGDQRYLDFREDVELETKAAVESWFTFVATIFKQFGKDVIANTPGVFGLLREAHDRREQELGDEMDRLHGPKC